MPTSGHVRRGRFRCPGLRTSPSTMAAMRSSELALPCVDREQRASVPREGDVISRRVVAIVLVQVANLDVRHAHSPFQG